MFYRRKILLALLEKFGGELGKMEMEKLLFLYCHERGVNYYDFFPHRYGCFSFLSYQDKRVLTSQGYLKSDESFVLKPHKSWIGMLNPDDKLFLNDFANKRSKLRGRRLVREVYLNHPYFACRSEIKHKILNSAQLIAVESHSPKANKRCLFTIGYEGLTIDAYINKLIRHSVLAVIDVRRNPLSMKYGFSKTRFRGYLERVGIAYAHIPELGIASAQRSKLETEADYRSLFKRYAKALPDSIDEISIVKQLLAEHRRVALTCFESVATSCHRHKITEYLQLSRKWNTPVVHIA